MPHILKHTFVCDICGAEETESFELSPMVLQGISAQVPKGWSFIHAVEFDRPETRLRGFECFLKTVNEKILCPKHTIQVRHNGDFVTLRKGEGDGEEVHQGGN